MIIRGTAGSLLFCSLLIILIVASSVTVPRISSAESLPKNASPIQAYNIQAGYLYDALMQFSEQAGIKLVINPEMLQGKVTPGLVGNFEIKTGLDQLLIGSGLQLVQRAEGFAIIEATTVANEKVTTLPSIQVTATSTNRYSAVSSTTATKTNTLLRDVPQAISVITNELIKDQSIRNLSDAIRYVPGVGVSQGEGNRDALVFRGNRSTGDFFTDGIRDDVEYYRDLYNIERVEVLKGANGMIFGRGGSGGVVNRVTKQATWDPIREFTFQGGSFNQMRMTADVGHVVHEKVAVRLNAIYEDAGSFRDGVDMERLGISPTVTFKPTNRTKVVVNMERYHDDRTADRGIPSLMGRPVNVHESQFFGDPNRSKANIDVLSFNSLIEHKFDAGVTLQNRTNYATYDKFYQNIFANGQVIPGVNLLSLGAYNNATTRENVFNQTNLLYSLNTGPILHTLMAGIEVGRQETHNHRRNGFFNNDPAQVNLRVPLSNPITNTPVDYVTRDTDANNRSVVNVTSLYIQDQIEVLPQLQLIAGVRYDLFEVDFQQKNADKEHLKTKDGLIAPRFGVIYKPIAPVSFYASYSQAYVPRAGDQLTGITITTAVLKPEKFTTLETGVKWDIRPDLALTGAVFQLDRTNVITADPNDPSRTFLAKGQRTEGVEVSLNGQLASNWNVMGGYAYQTGEFTSDLPGIASKGASVGELPRHTFSIWNRYDLTPWLGAAFGVIYRGSMFASADNTIKIPDFTRVDAALFARLTSKVRAQLNIENLLDTNYFASVHNNNNIMPGSPIAVRGTLIVNF
ncbi:TonB-dependent siderophore receptor [Nitrosomonas sp. JL21]|nr:TonB-dependent siderophore receptor [Nitrosomonas sp.]MXS78920.1 TonB-dependent siderophore receptor [Nitrosomonas sp. JL21]